MEKLRMLKIVLVYLHNQSNEILPSSLESLPDGLKILRWDRFPQGSLPSNFSPENLVTLEMTHSHLKQLDQAFPKLKRLDLRESIELIRIPDLYLSPDIEVILLSGCERLTEVYSSGFLNKLNSLRLERCSQLRSLTIPSNILSRSSGLITLRYCEKLETFSIPNRSRGWDNGTASDSKGILSRVEKEKCLLDLSYCESLTSLSSEFHLSKLKFLKILILNGCLNFEIFPEIEDTMESLAVLELFETAIQALPPSLGRLVGLQELSLRGCASLETIPSSIGNLSKLCNLCLTNCKSLETFPSSIFMLKLTKLDLSGCSKLRTFPEILEPAKTFAHIDLIETAIKELPSSFGNLVRLQTLHLNMCTDLESLPNSIVNLNLLSVLDCPGCAKLTDIPSDIGCLSLLRELSLSESGIVKLPESIAHLSSLELLDLSECKKLQCIPRLPPFLKKLLAFDCQSITIVMSNSLIQIPSNSKVGGIFEFYFTNGQQLDPGAHANIVDEARLKMTNDAYGSVFFCFPGSQVPHWFPFCGEGHSITINTGSLNFCSDDRLIGFALCVVYQLPDTDDIEGVYCSFSYCLKYESDNGEHILPNNDKLKNDFCWMGRLRKHDQYQTVLWKYNLEFPGMNGKTRMLPRARSITFEIGPFYYDNYFKQSFFLSIVRVKECGICPIYTKEKDDNNAGADDYSGSVRFSNNDIEEPSGNDVAWMEEGLQ